MSSDDSEPFIPRRPPLDFSADGEFWRGMNLPRRPGIEAEIDKMVAESEARHAAKLAAAAAMSHAARDAVGEKEGAFTPDGADDPFSGAAAPALPYPGTAAPHFAASLASSPIYPPKACATAATAVATEEEPAPVFVPAHAAPPVGLSRDADLAAEIATLRAENAGLRSENAAQRATIAENSVEIAALRAEIAELATLRMRVAALVANPSPIQQ